MFSCNDIWKILIDAVGEYIYCDQANSIIYIFDMILLINICFLCHRKYLVILNSRTVLLNVVMYSPTVCKCHSNDVLFYNIGEYIQLCKCIINLWQIFLPWHKYWTKYNIVPCVIYLWALCVSCSLGESIHLSVTCDTAQVVTLRCYHVMYCQLYCLITSTSLYKVELYQLHSTPTNGLQSILATIFLQLQPWDS